MKSCMPRTGLFVFVALLLGTAALARPDGSAASTAHWRGSLLIVHVDSTRENRDHYEHFLVSGNEQTRLRGDLTGAAPGSKITVWGRKRGDTITVAGWRSVAPTLAERTAARQLNTSLALLPNTGATLPSGHLLVILVTWNENGSMLVPTQTQDDVRSVVFDQANAWFQDTSYGSFGLHGDVTPWLTIPKPQPSCDIPYLTKPAKAAAKAAGFDPASYDMIVIAFPRSTCAPWLGFGAIGAPPAVSNGPLTLHVVTHELGHNLGLWHSHAVRCTEDGAYVTLSNSCIIDEYGDGFDTMGNPYFSGTTVNGYEGVGPYNAYQKSLLGWLDGRLTIAPPGTSTTTISPYELQSVPHAQAIEIPSADRTYWVEYRQAYNWDSYLAADPTDFTTVLKGVLVHISNDARFISGGSGLIDMNTTTGNAFYPAMLYGTSYLAPNDAFRLSIGTGDGAEVPVTVDYSTDSTAPGPISAKYPLAGGYARSHHPTLRWSQPLEQGSGLLPYSVHLDGGAETITAQPYQGTTGLADGWHSWAVTAADRAGNTSASPSFRFYVDTHAPTAFAASVTPRTDSVVVRWTASSDSGSGLKRYRIGVDGHWQRSRSFAPTTHRAVLKLSPGQHHIRVLAYDRAGNRRPAATVRFRVT
jgi:hypothetical protein